MFDEDSLAYKIGTTLASFGEAVPVHMKLKLAEQDADRKQQETKLGWDNFYQNNAKMRMLQQKHNQEAQMAYFEHLPRFKYQIAAIEDPVQRQQFTELAAKMSDSLYPGGGDFLRYFAKNPASVYDGDDLAEDPDYGPVVKERIAGMGYENWMKSKERESLSATRNFDRLTFTTGHMPDEAMKQLSAGNMTEKDFRAAYVETLKDSLVQGQITQRGLMAAKMYLNTPEAEEQMAGLGVQTNKAALARQLKEKTQSPRELQAEKNFAQWQKIVDTDTSNKAQTQYTPQEVADAKESLMVANKQMAPRSNPSDTPNNPLNQRLEMRTKGEIRSVGDIARMPKTRQPALYKLAETVQAELDAAKPEAAASAQEGKSADTTGYYDLNALKTTGNLKPVRGRVSIEELRSNSAYGKFNEKQIQALTDMQVVEGSSKQIFDAARKAYAGSGGSFLQSQAESALMNDPTSPGYAEGIRLAKKYYPDLSTYLARRESTLGKFARSVSGEVGVLTDQDVIRVRNLFPTAGDTASMIKSKEKALAGLVALNKRFLNHVLTGGEFDTVRASEVRNSPQFFDAKEGILGSVEGLSAAPRNKPKQGLSSLMDKMEAGR
jgi:hypothetical protein